jgi:hypothetical protein
MQDAKVRIAHALMSRGWDVQGYHADESDSMTDYYSPAYWNGIATKNGFILVVDQKSGAEAREITKYNYNNTSYTDQEKIKKLEEMTQERGCTEGEEQNAKQLIENIKNKESENTEKYEVIGMTLAHMGNPSTSKWHIEKDGKIYDKGTGITKYADMPKEYEYDIVKMEFNEGHKYYRSYNMDEFGCRIKEERTITDEQKKNINDFKALILRFEAIVIGANTCGDGTAETEQAAAQQTVKAGYKKVIETITKKVIKPVEKQDKTINLNDILKFTGSYAHGGYWMIIDIWKNNKGINCYTYELLGSEKRGYQQTKNGKRYYQTEASLQKQIDNNTVIINTMQEVTESKAVEKWVKIDESKPAKTPKPEQQADTVTETPTEATEQATQQNNNNNTFNYKYTITADTDTRDNSSIYVLKLVDKLSKEEYIKASEELKALKGYYSKFKHGFIFKYDVEKVLQGSTSDNNSTTDTTPEEASQEETKPQDQQQNNNIIEGDFMPDDNRTQETNQDILNKFDDIIIENNKRIDPDDEAFCITEQEKYNNTLETLNKISEVLKLSNNNYLSGYDFNNLDSLPRDKKEKFIINIISYFVKKYSITIDPDKVFKKYQNKEVDYNILLDEVFTFLGGFSFLEKSINEVKTKCKEKSYNSYRKEFNITLKNNTLTINNSYVLFSHTTKYEYINGKRIDTPVVESGYRASENIKPYLDAISLFEFNKVIELDNRFYNYNITITPEEFSNGIKILNCKKLNIIKFFKNGRMDLKFNTSQQAAQFAKEYCGYNPITAGTQATA